MSIYRRDHERFSVNESAALITDSGTENPLILEDLSVRGAGVISDYPFRIDEKVTVFIRTSFLFGSPTLKKAKTVWCRKINGRLWQAGLDFGRDNLLSF